MNKKHLLIVGILGIFAANIPDHALAQVSELASVQVNPRGTYLFVELSCNNDLPEEPTSVTLSTLGITPGMHITLRRTGAYQLGDAFNDDNTRMGAVFKGPSGFLAATSPVLQPS